MGDDLISREKALEVVKRHMCDSANIEQGILELPTACFIDKVVKQINEEGSMERLTGRSANGTAIYSKPSRSPVKWQNNRCDVLCKLAEYEDLEEKGLLLRLPCKVGDTVYRICPKCNDRHNESCENCAWRFSGSNEGCNVYGLWKDGQYPSDKCTIVPYKVTWYYIPNLLDHIGKTAFLTREEAEAALHIQGDTHD